MRIKAASNYNFLSSFRLQEFCLIMLTWCMWLQCMFIQIITTRFTGDTISYAPTVFPSGLMARKSTRPSWADRVATGRSWG